jgi:hypothetical protein
MGKDFWGHKLLTDMVLAIPATGTLTQNGGALVPCDSGEGLNPLQKRLPRFGWWGWRACSAGPWSQVQGQVSSTLRLCRGMRCSRGWRLVCLSLLEAGRGLRVMLTASGRDIVRTIIQFRGQVPGRKSEYGYKQWIGKWIFVYLTSR